MSGQCSAGFYSGSWFLFCTFSYWLVTWELPSQRLYAIPSYDSCSHFQLLSSSSYMHTVTYSYPPQPDVPNCLVQYVFVVPSTPEAVLSPHPFLFCILSSLSRLWHRSHHPVTSLLNWAPFISSLTHCIFILSKCVISSKRNIYLLFPRLKLLNDWLSMPHDKKPSSLVWLWRVSVIWTPRPTFLLLLLWSPTPILHTKMSATPNNLGTSRSA